MEFYGNRLMTDGEGPGNTVNTDRGRNRVVNFEVLLKIIDPLRLFLNARWHCSEQRRTDPPFGGELGEANVLAGI